jgi:PAS domain S-box-containing protein
MTTPLPPDSVTTTNHSTSLTPEAELAQLRARIAELEQRLAERTWKNDALEALAFGTASATGREFLQALVRQLALALHTQYAFVTEWVPGRTDRLRTVAGWCVDRPADPLEYDLADSPCHKVMQGGTAFFPRNLCQIFPQDEYISTLKIESYMGVVLLNQAGMPTGHLCVMDVSPFLLDESQGTAIIKAFAERAAAEIERIRAEETLRASEEQFRALVDSATDAIVLANHEGRIVSWNKASEQIFGYSLEEVLGQPLTILMPPRYRQKHEQGLARMESVGLESLVRKTLALVGATKQGREFPLELSLAGWRSRDGLFFSGIIRDISERTQAEAALRASEERLQRFVAEAPVGLVIVDNQQRLLSANKAFCALTGYSEQEIVGNTYALYTHPDDLPDNLALTNAFFEGTRSSYTYEKRYIRKSGDMIWVSVTTTGIELPGQTGPLLLAVVKDISERKRITEERERISQDLHDGILQSLYAVGMGLEHTRQRVKRTSPTNARRLDTSVAQLNDAIREVRSFIPRMQAPAIQHGAFDQALLAIVQSLAVAGAGDIELAIDKSVADGLSHTQCGPVLSITKEAMSNSLRHAGAAHRRVTVQLYRGKFRLEVFDDGKGFRPTARKSSGMGLANMRARARKLGARLTIRSRPGQGTQVVLSIPLPAQQATA